MSFWNCWILLLRPYPSRQPHGFRQIGDRVEFTDFHAPPPAICPADDGHDTRSAVGPDVDHQPLGHHGDPAHRQLHDPALLDGEQLAPVVIEGLQSGDNLGLGEGVNGAARAVTSCPASAGTAACTRASRGVASNSWASRFRLPRGHVRHCQGANAGGAVIALDYIIGPASPTGSTRLPIGRCAHSATISADPPRPGPEWQAVQHLDPGRRQRDREACDLRCVDGPRGGRRRCRPQDGRGTGQARTAVVPQMQANFDALHAGEMANHEPVDECLRMPLVVRPYAPNSAAQASRKPNLPRPPSQSVLSILATRVLDEVLYGIDRIIYNLS